MESNGVAIKVTPYVGDSHCILTFETTPQERCKPGDAGCIEKSCEAQDRILQVANDYVSTNDLEVTAASWCCGANSYKYTLYAKKIQ